MAGATNIPTPLPPLGPHDQHVLWNRLAEATARVPRSTMILVYCKKGIRSGVAARMLRAMGFSGVINLGGIEDPGIAQMARRGQLGWVR